VNVKGSNVTENKMQFDVVVIAPERGVCSPQPDSAHRGIGLWSSKRLDKVGGRASTDDIDGFK